MSKYLTKVNESQKVEEVPKLGLGLALFITDFHGDVHHHYVYVSIAIKLSKSLTGLSMHSVSTFNKANVNSFT